MRTHQDAHQEGPELSKKGYMAELEDWLQAEVYGDIKAAIAGRDAKGLHAAFNEATAKIKRKILASYHNGLKARNHADKASGRD